jgi:PAS domain S-box-containing protein
MRPVGSRSVLAEYALAIDALPIVAWLANADGVVIHLSAAWQRFLRNNAALETANYIDLIHPDDLAAAVAQWDAARAASERYRGEFRMRAGDGAYRWIVSQANPIRDDGGAIVGWLGTAIDIHDRRVAEEALTRRNELLAQSEDRRRLLGESIPGTTWTATPDGRIDHIIEGASSAPRRPLDTRLGDEWLGGVHVDDRERVRALWHAHVAGGAPYEATFRVVMADGTYRWQLCRALPQRDDGGAIVRWVGVNVDIDDRVRADTERDNFVALAEKSNSIIGMTDAAGIVVYANPAALAFLDVSLEAIRGADILTLFPANDVPFVETVIRPAILQEGRWAGEFRLRNLRTQRVQPVLLNAFALNDTAGKITGFATISQDLRERQRVDIGMRALADAGKAMHDSLDFDTTMQNIVDAIVSGFANFCSVEVVDASGGIRTRTLAARNAADLPLAREMADVRNPAAPPDHPIRRAIFAGESTLRIVEPAFLAPTGLSPYIGTGPRQLDLRSIIYVPVRSPHDGRVHGSLSCGLDGDDPRGTYTDEDVRFAEEIAARAALAFDNARAYERASRIAVELQAASLPASLPECTDLELFAEYRPAGNEAAIGGDWYDAFRLPDGRVAITIGDVVGHGLHAAVWMTKMRQAMQAAAMLDPDPSVMLGVANRTLRLLERDVFATAMAAVYDGTTRHMTVASAGHPGPAVARADGTIEEPYLSGLMLGLADDAVYENHAIAVRAGDLVAFFTDGLVEADRDIERGYERLRAALRLASVKGAANPALAIFESVLSGIAIRDDVAILVARAVWMEVPASSP